MKEENNQERQELDKLINEFKKMQKQADKEAKEERAKLMRQAIQEAELLKQEKIAEADAQIRREKRLWEQEAETLRQKLKEELAAEREKNGLPSKDKENKQKIQDVD